jgi:hypothetical protein
MVSKELLEKFKKLYEEKFNTSLTDEEVTQMATDLINLMRVLLQPEPEATEEVNDERREDATSRTYPA